MSRLALPADVRLVFDPTMSATALDNDAFLGAGDDRDAVDSIIQNVESEFWQEVDGAFRLDERRRPEVHEVHRSGHRAYRLNFSRVGTRYNEGPVEIPLDHDRVFPFDTNSSPDKIEVRTGMDDWQDITSEQGDDWDLVDPSDGLLLVFVDNVFRTQGVDIRSSLDKVWIRVQYRFGARGGDIRVGGQTDLDPDGGSGVLSSSDSTPTTVDVADASRLPPAPATLLILPSDDYSNGEYVRVSSVDQTNDQITIETRGERLTSAVSHDANEAVHYAPPMVRNAVAKKSAIELTQMDDYSEWLPDTNIPLEAPRKIDEWRKDWNTALSLLS